MAYIYDLTDTWNAGGTTFNAIKMNVTDSASASASKLVTLQTNGTEHFSVTKGGQGYFSGNLGVGTASPGAKLTVSGVSEGLRLADSAPYMSFYNAAQSIRLGYIQHTGFSLALYNVLPGDLEFATNNTERMRITSAGAVGIGTGQPRGNLSIGTINSTSSTTQTFHMGYTPGDFYGWRLTSTNTPSVSAAGTFNIQRGTSAAWVDAVTITDGGNVGIGTSSPEAKLTVAGTAGAVTGAGLAVLENSTGNSARLRIIQNAGFVTYDATYSTGGNQQVWSNAGTERMRLTEAGNLGIGITAPVSYANYGNLTVNGTNGGTFTLRNSANTNSSEMAANASEVYLKSVGSTPLWFGTDNNERMRIDTSGNVGIGTNSIAYTTSGRTTVYTNGTSSSLLGLGVGGTEAGYVGAFSSTALEIAAAGASRSMVLTTNGAERARITTSGEFMFPNSTFSRPGGAGQYIVGADNGGFFQQVGTNYYTVTTSGGSTSDASLKTDIVNIDSALDRICALNGVTYQFIEIPQDDADKGEQIGVIAQDVEAQFPQIVVEGSDGMKRVRYDRLVAPLIEAIKELTARVAQLEGN
jgi:hypothetical protein